MDLGFGFLWWVERMGCNVGGLLIILGTFLRLSASLGDASGVRCGLLMFLSIFSIRCMSSDAGYAVQCLSPEYRSIWFQLVFFSTDSCFWDLRKIITIIIINIDIGSSSISW